MKHIVISFIGLAIAASFACASNSAYIDPVYDGSPTPSGPKGWGERPDIEALRADLAAGAPQLRGSLIDPVIERLRVELRDDAETQALLDKLEISLPSTVSLSPSARGMMSHDRRRVEIDAAFLARSLGVSDVASLFLVQPLDAGNVVHQIGFNYGRACAQAIERNEEPPWVKVDTSPLELSPSFRSASRLAGMDILAHFTTWVLLHEIGHHRLQHFGHEPGTLAEQRQEELAADAWATRQLNRLDYSMTRIEAALMAMSLLESFWIATGQTPPEEESTHPHWSTRFSAVSRLVANEPPPATRMMMLEWEGEVINPAGGTLMGKWQFAIPRNTSESGNTAVVAFNDEINLAGFEYVGGTAAFYLRDGNNRTAFLLEDPWNHASPLRIVNRDLATGQEVVTSTLTARRSAVVVELFNVKTEKTKTARQMMALGPVEGLSAQLEAAQLSPDLRARSTPILRASTMQTGRLMLSFTRGDIGQQELMDKFTQAHQFTRTQLRSALGPEGLAQFDAAMRKTPAFELQKAMEQRYQGAQQP